MQSARIHLSIDLDSDPITGSLSEDDAAPRQFCGWMELVEAIEVARKAAVADGEPITLGEGLGKP